MALGKATERVVDFVRNLKPRLRYVLEPEEQELAIHLRGNDALLKSLSALVSVRIRSRELTEVPSDPMDCKSSMVRDKELRWLLARLDYIYHSPVSGEQPEE